MQKILVLCNVNPNSNPRPNRMIHWLVGKCELTVVARNKISIDGVKSFAYESHNQMPRADARLNSLEALRAKIDGDFTGALSRFLLRYVNLALKRYEKVNWLNLGNARALVHELSKEHFDLIISHDLVLLPFAFKVKGWNTKVMLDAREYYPRNFDDDWMWRHTKKPVNEYLCDTYLRNCDKVITVSPGLSDEYRRVFGIETEVIMSLPDAQALQPSPTVPGTIRMIHHGNANQSRKTELMIEMMDYVDQRFSLDLMMLSTDMAYWKKIVEMSKTRNNVRVIPTVPMQEIVKEINKYDVGLYLASPGNFNVEYMLPNKLFEFIQARLAVAIGPSVEMKKITEKYGCGIVSQDFSPQSLAQELNQLSEEKLGSLKRHSHQAARELNATVTGKRIHEIVKDLLKN